MDKPVEEFIEGLFSDYAATALPHTSKEEVDAMELPPWFDREKFDQGRRFYQYNCFSLSLVMYFGLLGLLAVPSALRVFMSTGRSSTPYTAYKRYTATIYHLQSWFYCELKPGTLSWKSLLEVRNRHHRTNLSSKTRKSGVVSQRDLSLTVVSMIGFGVLKPTKLGIRALRPGDWDAYMHVWRVIGYMMGIEDRYNTCRPTEPETRAVMQIIVDRLFAPCLENVPEHFEHMAEALIEGQQPNIPFSQPSAMFYCRYLAGVPGYILTEEKRIDLCNKLKEQLGDQPVDTGVDSRSLMASPAVALPALPPRLHRLHDYATLAAAPAYSTLTTQERFKLQAMRVVFILGTTHLGRVLLNAYFRCAVFLSHYAPCVAWLRYGLRAAYVDMFKDGPADHARPRLNAQVYAERERDRNSSWFTIILW